MNFTIDNKSVSAQDGDFILKIARENGIGIPTLCDHQGVEAWGGCRLCLVEVTKTEWNGWSTLVTSCLYPAKEGLIVSTNSPNVCNARAVVLDLLMARCPEVEELKRLGKVYGLTETSYVKRKDADKCILCGLCVRVCNAVGAVAITTVGRGVIKKVTVPLAKENLSTCVGCLSCALNCPTGEITYEETNKYRKIWGMTFDVVHCPQCGKPIGTPQELKHFAEKSGLDPLYFEYCDNCNKNKTADKFASVTFK
jgi:NADH dehydrogenase/NADH:ubiquinone oxidoreductase subunit G